MAVAYHLPAAGKAPEALEHGSEIRFEEAAYTLRGGEQGDFDSEVLRLVYSSLSTPATVIDQHLGTGKRRGRPPREECCCAPGRKNLYGVGNLVGCCRVQPSSQCIDNGNA